MDTFLKKKEDSTDENSNKLSDEKEQLKESDVILFVMSSEGAFSLNKNFEDLIGIVRSGKHLVGKLTGGNEVVGIAYDTQ